MTHLPLCPGCARSGRSLSVAVGHFEQPGEKTTLKVPVGQPLCDECFEKRGIPKDVLLTKYEGPEAQPD